MRFPSAVASAVLVAAVIVRLGAQSAPASCDLVGYRAQPGLTAERSAGGVIVSWSGDAGSTVRARLAIESQQPVVKELAIKADGAAAFTPVLVNARPEFTVVSGLRRMTNQQLDPLAGLGVPITKEILEKEKWEAFWDAPLHVPGPESAHNNTTTPQKGVLDQPGLPRAASEVNRSSVRYRLTGCTVKTDGARVEVTFPGATLGVFNGRLQYTFYKGTNLMRQELIATTTSPAGADKSGAGTGG